MPLDVVVLGPFQDRLARELGPVVRDDADWLAVEAHHRIQLARDPGAGDAGIGDQAEVLAAAVVVDGQDAEPARGPERVRHEVHGPSLVRAQSLRHRRPAATSALAASSAAHRQALFPIQAVKLLVVHHHALAFQQDAEAPVAEPAPLLGELAHFIADLRVVGRPFPPHRLRIDTDQNAGPALREIMIPHRLQGRVPPLLRCRQGFPSKSFNTTLSSIVSAKSRLSLAFSSSSCFSRLASDNSIPPYLAFSL